MAPTKETLEGTTNNSTAVSQINSRLKASDRMRADAVSLEVPVKVHGTRVSEAASGITSSEPFEEETSTMIVFPQGGVLKMATPVAPNQMIVVTNLKSGHDSICRIVKVRAYAPGQSYVEIEFTHRQAGYWGVYFPSDGADGANQIAPVKPPAPAPPISVEVKVEKPAEKAPPETADGKPMPAPPNVKPVASQPESIFAPIGSQEEVQPAAAATSSRAMPGRKTEPASKQLSAQAASKKAIELPAAASLSPAGLSIDGSKESAYVSPLALAGTGALAEAVDAPETESVQSSSESAAPLGRFAAAASPGNGRGVEREPFGSGFGSGTFGLGAGPSEPRRSGPSSGAMLAVAAVALLAGTAGAAYHFGLLPFGRQSTPESASPISAPVASVSAPVGLQQTLTRQPADVSSALPQIDSRVAASAPTANASSVKANASISPLTASTKPAEAASVPATPDETSAARTLKPATKAPNLLAALKAHPKTRKHAPRSADADAAPELDTLSIDGAGALSEIGTPSPLAPPTGESQAPVRIRVGGALKPPRLLSSVKPVYPAMARDAGIEGDVVIDTAIDPRGNITSARVVSGPPMLRQAALDALRQWKYAPSMLNGEPVPVQVTVTIKFHRD
jgi:protein TonB